MHEKPLTVVKSLPGRERSRKQEDRDERETFHFLYVLAFQPCEYMSVQK